MEKRRLSVGELCQAAARTGSIDNRFSGPDRAGEGRRIHRAFARRERGDIGYRAEVPFRHTATIDDIQYEIRGRADGLYEEAGGAVVEELKTALRETAAENEAHFSQGICYAYFYCLEKGISAATVRLLYHNPETGAETAAQRSFTFAELETFFAQLLGRYHAMVRRKRDFEKLRDASLANFPFPYDRFRPGQKGLCGRVYKAMVQRQHLYCAAPTGLGKTMATLWPALKALGEGKGERIFYLTAKTLTREEPRRALERMLSQGLQARAIVLAAKEKCCFLEKPECNPEVCPYAAGYFDRSGKAVEEFLESQQLFTPQFIAEEAQKRTLCPFELSLDIAGYCDVVIGDYNHLFDSRAGLRRFFGDEADIGKESGALLLLDEAHNLPDRLREIYSAVLSKSAIALGKKTATAEEGKKLATALQGLVKEMAALEKQWAEEAMESDFPFREGEPPAGLLKRLDKALVETERYLAEKRGGAHPLLLDLYFALSKARDIADRWGPEHLLLPQGSGRELRLKFFCRDPGRLAAEALQKARGAVLFSATLYPLRYYMNLLGEGEGAEGAVFLPPFPPENLCLLVSGADSRYKARQQGLLPLAQALFALVNSKSGNYISFFPSYAYMRQGAEVFRRQYPHHPVLVQQAGEGEGGKAAFLAALADTASPKLAFCVLGGSYAEGIDLADDRLLGCCVVSPGLPPPEGETLCLQQYYEGQEADGFLHAFAQPGMNRVQQAAGRVIRSETDRGAVLLYDRRFLQSYYRQLLLPQYLNGQRADTPEEIAEALDIFWHRDDESIEDPCRQKV